MVSGQRRDYYKKSIITNSFFSFPYSHVLNFLEIARRME
jgi:hypothetical protein